MKIYLILMNFKIKFMKYVINSSGMSKLGGEGGTWAHSGLSLELTPPHKTAPWRRVEGKRGFS